jgi:hypothetical protein
MKSSFKTSFLPLLMPIILAASAYASTYTAASSSQANVAAAVAQAADGDTVQIPCSAPTSVTWTSTLTVTKNITITGMGATPNSGTSTFGAGTNCLTITAAVGTLFELDPTYSATNQLVLQNLNLDPGSGATTPIHVSGNGTANGMPQVRINNIYFGKNAQWAYSPNGEFLIIADNVVGVADHNTVPNGSKVAFLSANMTSYMGVGQFGDNSWAQPDSMGGANNFFLENNQVTLGGWPLVENEQTWPAIGGGRAVSRFNQVNGQGIYFLTGGHGLDTDGRPRSMRHNETYGNSVTCSSGTCYDLCSYRGGTGLCFGNNVTVSGGAYFNDFVGLSTYRAVGDVNSGSGFGGCGDAGSGTPTGPFDYNDGATYDSGTATSGSSGTTLVDSTKSWTNSQWRPSGQSPYYVWNLSKGFVDIVVSSSSNSIAVHECAHGVDGNCPSFSPGDSYQIRRSQACLDQSGRGAGLLITGTSPVLSSTGLPGPAKQALDPIYEWNNKASSLSSGANVNGSWEPQALANRDYYSDNSLGSPRAQTSPTSPFNGASGVGFGTLANRPTACTAGVGYFATDQGSWNTSSNGFGNGVLYKCTSTNTWTASYTPYAYPHPLASGNPNSGGTSPSAPTNLTYTVK